MPVSQQGCQENVLSAALRAFNVNFLFGPGQGVNIILLFLFGDQTNSTAPFPFPAVISEA
jgi:hypothetical protein